MYIHGMSRTMNAQTLYLDPKKAALLADLSEKTRIPKAVLLREAVDLLLTQHGELSAGRGAGDKPKIVFDPLGLDTP